MKKTFVRISLLITMLPMYSFIDDSNTTEKVEFAFIKDTAISYTDSFGKPLSVKGTVVDSRLVELAFLESKPIVSVTISEVITGAVAHHQVLSTQKGHQYQISVAGYQAGTYNIVLTDEEKDEVISGEFDIK